MLVFPLGHRDRALLGAVLAVLDGKFGTADYAFDAHCLPMRALCYAVWESWAAVSYIEWAICDQHARLAGKGIHIWKSVTGLRWIDFH